MRKNVISRRHLLRGTGVSLALPWLEIMGQLTGKASASASQVNTAGSLEAPIRMACIFFPNGVWRDDWFPKEAGSDYAMTPSLAPLEKHRQNLNVFSGLDKKNSHTNEGHYSKTANFLTGLSVQKTTGKDLNVGGASLDQICAQKIGSLTPLPSLELGTDPVISGIDNVVGYTRLYGSYISWRSSQQPVAREINPRAAFERIFRIIQATHHRVATDPRESGDREALLDLVLDDARSLRRRLGRDDQSKLDEYLDSVHDLEKRITFFSQPDPRAWRPASQYDGHAESLVYDGPDNFQEQVRLMFDLMTLAFRTDSTRITTFMMANDVSGRNFSQLIPGVNGGFHEFSHHQNKKENYEPYAKINRWHCEQFAYFLDKLSEIKEGERTLLDNSLILFGSSLSDGNSHQPDNLPIILAGGAGGTIKPGRHHAMEKGTPLCNLYRTMLERMGSPVDAFGDSTGMIDLG